MPGLCSMAARITHAHLAVSVAGPSRSVQMQSLIARSSSQRTFPIYFLAIALLLPAALYAQAYFGTVSGELTDSTGAVVQGATIILTDQQKGFSFNTTSDSSGRYLFRSVAPGVYTVS